MQKKQQLCSKQGHQGCKLTHICIKRNSKNRYWCHECMNKDQRVDCYECWDNDHLLYSLKDDIIQIDKFPQFFKDQRLPLIQKRLESQNGNQAKLKYLKKVYDVDFGDLGGFNLKNQKDLLKEIKYMIQDLIDEYEREIKEAQLLNVLIEQLTLNGLQSLNIGQLDILLGRQCKFINDEFEHYNQINQQLNKLDDKQYQIDEKKFYLEYQKVRKIQKDLRKINDYLNFQDYSTDGKELAYDEVFIYEDGSFFSRNDRYYAMIHQQCITDLYQLKIRQQNTLNVTQKLNLLNVWRIRFDPLFNYCIIQLHGMSDFYYYNLNNKQFKLIRKFKIKSHVQGFYLSNLNNIILVLKDSIVIKALNLKNKLINEIMLQQTGHYEKVLFSYGSERNIIAVHFKDQVKIYQETQKQPFLCKQLDTQFKKMKLVNNDSQLLTQSGHYEIYWRLWQIDYSNQKITLINKIKTNIDQEQFFINQSEDNIIKLSYNVIQILDKNFVEWFSYTLKDEHSGSIYLTKHLLLIGNQVIKRRATIDYEKLQYE